MATSLAQVVPTQAALRAELARAMPLDARWQAPQVVAVVERTGSTNADLVESGRRAQAAGAPLPERMLRLARRQDAGRGRLARRWETRADAGLALSIGLRSALAPAALGGFALVCGLAAHAALADFGLDVRLKWPNDIVDAAGRAKLGGILVELVQLAERQTWIVIGIGINLREGAALSAALGRSVTDLAALGAANLDVNLLAARVVAQLEQRVAVFEREGFAPFVAPFDRVHAYQGRAVALGAGAHAATGTCIGVGPGGEVLLRRADGRIELVISGEASLAARGD